MFYVIQWTASSLISERQRLCARICQVMHTAAYGDAVRLFLLYVLLHIFLYSDAKLLLEAEGEVSWSAESYTICQLVDTDIWLSLQYLTGFLHANAGDESRDVLSCQSTELVVQGTATDT